MVAQVIARDYPDIVPFPRGVRVKVTILLTTTTRRGDVFNFEKALLDSLKGFAYADDAQIVEGRVIRLEPDKLNPFVHVSITPEDKFPVLDVKKENQ